MSNAVRYFSKFGHTAKMAAIVGELTNAEPATVATPLNTHVDTLYLGSGVMMGKVDASVAEFINNLRPELVGRVICFGSCAIIKSPVPQMRQLLEAKGIVVSDQEFTCRGSMGPLHMGHPNKEDHDNLRNFILKTLDNK